MHGSDPLPEKIINKFGCAAALVCRRIGPAPSRSTVNGSSRNMGAAACNGVPCSGRLKTKAADRAGAGPGVSNSQAGSRLLVFGLILLSILLRQISLEIII